MGSGGPAHLPNRTNNSGDRGENWGPSPTQAQSIPPPALSRANTTLIEGATPTLSPTSCAPVAQSRPGSSASDADAKYLGMPPPARPSGNPPGAQRRLSLSNASGKYLPIQPSWAPPFHCLPLPPPLLLLLLVVAPPGSPCGLCLLSQPRSAPACRSAA